MRYSALLTAALALLLTLAACQSRSTFTIEGSVEGAQDSMLYFTHMSLEGPVALDSVRLDADGHFSFSHERPEAPDFYVLSIADQIINLSIDSTETVSVTAHWPDMAARYEVEGSDNCARIRELALMQQELQRRAIRLEGDRSLQQQARQDSLARMLKRYKDRVATNYIYREPDKAYAYFALFQTLGQWLIFNPRDNAADVRAFAAVATSWDTFHPNSLRAQNLHNITVEGMNNARIMAARQSRQLDDSRIVESGVIEVSLPDNHGRQRQLTSLKGQVVLLDFHAFSLKDSPQRILMLRDLYNKYHDQGLEIFQVSVDPDEHFWRQMTAQLPWICVRDDEGESALHYNVQQVPEYFIIDRNNTLQKRSSQMKDLETEIRALL